MIPIHFVQYYPKIIIYYHILNNKIYACIVFIDFQIYIYIYIINFILCYFMPFLFFVYSIPHYFRIQKKFFIKKKKKKNCIKREWNVLTWGIFLTEPLDEIKALIALGRAAKIKCQLRGIGQRNISLILFLLLFFFSFPLSPFILSLSSHYFSSFPSFFR